MIFHGRGRGRAGWRSGGLGLDKAATAPVTIIIRQKCKHACQSRAEEEDGDEHDAGEEIQRFPGKEREREREPPQIKDVSDSGAAISDDGELMVK